MRWLLFLLLPTLALAQTVYVAPTGNDATACGSVTKQAPRRSINAGLGCVQPGGTLEIADGSYEELLIGLYSAPTCLEADAARQQPCNLLVNGPDPEHPTRLIAPGGNAMLSPRTALSGGGGIITLYSASKHLHFEGIKLVKNSASGSAEGFVGGDAQHITFTRGELDRGAFKSSQHSQHFTVTHNYMHHAGHGVCPEGQKPTPSQCAHGLYMCGKHHAITDNTIEYSSYYNLQVSCEQGGIEDIRIERNIIRYAPVVGIRCAGQGCLVASNLLVGNGQGMTLSGSGTVAHNTIANYQPQPYNPDPFAVFYGGNYQIVDNVITGQKSSFYTIANDQFSPIDTSKVHHNLCSESGNVGCPIIGSAEAVYTNPGQGDYTLRRSLANPALGAGVPVAGVTTDLRGRPFHGTHPSLGAYALTPDTPPEPIPPTPPVTGLVLACEGALQDQGRIALTCVQQEGQR